MNKVKNRRTLKKRIRRAMSLSAFVTAVIISGLIICIILASSIVLAKYQADVVCEAVQKEINSGQANTRLGISKIEEISDTEQTRSWADGFNRMPVLNIYNSFDRRLNHIYIKIEIGDSVVFSNDNGYTGDFTRMYKHAEATLPIMNSDDVVIGNVTVRVDPQVLVNIVGPISLLIIILSVLSLLISKLLSLFLTIPIINPVRQLERKVKAIADEDQETAANTQLVLKRPLREIESLADSTNLIMKKLNGYNELLESQKEVLENQNAELEVQNDELIKSKQQIQEQQAQLVQSEKMASVGLLTAAITHEINTPIGAINSNAQMADLLLSGLAEHPAAQSDEELRTMLGQLKEVNDINLDACRRIIEIIKSLKSFSRLDQADFQEADINEGIKSVLVLTNNLLKRRITVHEDYGDLPPVKCFPGQLNQVFMNIIVNASQAIEGEGELFIRTRLQDRFIITTIQDTGSGIAKENLSKIFDPGFTTKGVGIGLGLGLYISYNIVQNHNGEISVVSEPGQGTEFTIKIPIDNDRT